MYDYLIVGAGLFGSVFAYIAESKGKKCLVVDRRDHIAGNIYTDFIEGINVHRYGAHIFHTSDKVIWDFVNRFAVFNRYTNCPVARYGDEIYNLPFNMNTFSRMWGVCTPEEAKKKIAEQTEKCTREPNNLEEQALRLVGRDIYEKLVKGYTEKQWGKSACELPPFIIKRLPVRFTYDNNYFSDIYQGIPEGGYTQIADKLLAESDVRLSCDFLENRDELSAEAKKIIYTGTIDGYYGYKYGPLEYRSLRFETEVLDTDNYQGNAVVNYTERDVPYTRIIEHKHFEFGEQDKTVITREYPLCAGTENEPYYPVNDAANSKLYAKYKSLADKEKRVIFGGRLGEYRYLDMHKVIESAARCAAAELTEEGEKSWQSLLSL